MAKKTRKKIYLRCSSLGNLFVEGRGAVFTENDANRISELEFERDNLVNRNGRKVSWTDNKQEELDKLIAKRDAKPELSQTAKSEVEKLWLMNEKGYYNDLHNKYLTKGLLNEQEGLELVSLVEDNSYFKNKERREVLLYKDKDVEIWLTGEPDYVDEKAKRIKDIKCSWDAKTFMNSELSNLYEIQLQGYAILFDAETLELHYCLTDADDNLLSQEIWKCRNRYGIIDPDDEKFKPMLEQIKRNLVYSDNPAYTLEERVKTYSISRDKDFKKKLTEKAKLVAEYYKTIKLNKLN